MATRSNFKDRYENKDWTILKEYLNTHKED